MADYCHERCRRGAAIQPLLMQGIDSFSLFTCRSIVVRILLCQELDLGQSMYGIIVNVINISGVTYIMKCQTTL